MILQNFSWHYLIFCEAWYLTLKSTDTGIISSAYFDKIQVSTVYYCLHEFLSFWDYHCWCNVVAHLVVENAVGKLLRNVGNRFCYSRQDWVDALCDMTLERKSFDLLLRAKPTPVPLEPGGRGTIAPPDLADRLILFQPLGQIMLPILLLAPQDCQTFLRPCTLTCSRQWQPRQAT